MASLSQPELVVDLATQTNGVERVYGSEGLGAVGIPVCGGFDVDGDGHLDTAFAQIQASPLGRSLAGQVTLVFGDGSIGGELDTALAAVPPSRFVRFAGTAERETTGAEI